MKYATHFVAVAPYTSRHVRSAQTALRASATTRLKPTWWLRWRLQSGQQPSYDISHPSMALVCLVPSGLAPDPERRHRSALASGVVVRRRRAYRAGRRLFGHGSPVAGPRAHAPCAGWPVGRSRALRHGPRRSGRRWCGSGNPVGGALLLPGDLVRYTINSTSVTLTDPDAAPRREALLALARWMAQGDERSGSSRSTPVDGPSERATGSDPRGAAPDGVAPSLAGTASPGGGR
jgi:hypothetical protein